MSKFSIDLGEANEAERRAVGQWFAEYLTSSQYNPAADIYMTWLTEGVVREDYYTEYELPGEPFVQIDFYYPAKSEVLFLFWTAGPLRQAEMISV